MGYKLTFDDGFGFCVTFDLGWRRDKDGRPVGRTEGDIALSCYPHCALPLKCTLLIAADGTIREWGADFEHHDRNPYWHFDNGSGEYALGRSEWPSREGHSPTEAQAEAIAGLWIHKVKPFGISNGVGAPVCEWAFSQLGSAQEISNRYGDGSKVYLA